MVLTTTAFAHGNRVWVFCQNQSSEVYMADIETKIIGSAKLTNIFGRWPSFHDAEILELNFLAR
jgi:hypothetical protein